MSIHALIPFLLVLACAGIAWFLPRFVEPSVGVVILTVFVMLATLATGMLLVQIGGAGISEVPFVADAIGWCRALSWGDHGAPPILGAAAVLTLGFVLTRVGRYARKVFQNRRDLGAVDGIEILASNDPIAFAVPGRRGGVVISDSLLSLLRRDEQRVVVAHENAHLRHRHHLYIHLVGACAAGLPFLQPFSNRVNYLTERWADEVAAERIGSREFVADTIARVALLPSSQVRSAPLSIGGGNVVNRFEALVSPLPAPTTGLTVFACSVVTAAVLGLTLQLHHLIDFITHAGHL
ncbi:MAG: M48 family metalloprotease [Actinobacteria bacterium]|uniref:Unannotated protein n=1 Tax=freshwater metagenome TaxID=449393 RepID=A0A6J6JIW1_9ZZZZ|nr:M48 family metalloprotease [Actinomycetota bacterium]MSZ93795.1 M48 family metalloprotease [Actinomycetota bacterium]